MLIKELMNVQSENFTRCELEKMGAHSDGYNRERGVGMSVT